MQHLNSLLSLGKNWSGEPLENANGPDLRPPLRVVTVVDPLFLSIDPEPDGSHRYSGYLYELWKIVASELDLNYQLEPLPAADYGTLDPNGTWTGLVGQLAYGHADVALASLDMTPARAGAVDFLDAVPVDQSTTGFLVHRGIQETPQLFSLLGSLLKPLDANVWWVLLFSWLTLAVILCISLHFNRGRAENQQMVDEMSWSHCILVCYMTMVGQGWATTPDSLAARTVTICCWALSIIIYASYTANLISHLTVVTKELPISSLAEFLERSDWKFAVPAGNSQISEWRSSSDPLERALYKRYISGEDILVDDFTTKAGLGATIKERVLVYTDYRYLKVIVGPESCQLAPVPGTRKRSVLAFIAVAKRMNGLRERINQLLLKMATGGLISRLKWRWAKSSEVTCDNPSGYKPISFSDTLAVLMLVPLSLCASMLMLFLERAFSFHGTKPSSRCTGTLFG